MSVQRENGLAVAVFTQRVKASLTQEELAAQAGLSTRTVRNIETGLTRPQPHTIRQFGTALKVDLRDLAIVSEDVAQSGRPRADEARAALPTPAQLPADLRGFVCRDEELAHLDGLVTGSVVAISGTAGVGKTALRGALGPSDRRAFPRRPALRESAGLRSRRSEPGAK